ncbi:hypothetical protein MNEG_6006 [Monoraphidium neglectum]|uniref:Domain of unknown function at the cortex 1 domain-containing protein n=1 Tax=Monoraphidium neglectum TaxID=145388 RepID=A0A0D2L479_9CHLO|nr:hypothetical protein MNEG_6006 [Monoraphidium neglectum]KIZ01954.1 hypothetical protein MNEG_6006 [Monoraphidium neglectum]|eukprot:XP_013900973.1 hypothetical protein MNEG_6006 [Monoraphidium neglectum]
MDGNPDIAAPIPLNGRAVEFESALFKGRLLLSVRGAPGDAAALAPGGPLAGGRRSFHVAVQGTFKRPVAAEQLLSGQEFPKPPKTSPTFMHFVFSAAAKVFASVNEVFVQEGEPMHFRFPVLAAAQLVNVAPRGQEPPLLEAQEDVRLFCPQLAASDGAPAPAAARRRLFDAPGGLAGVTMSPDHVWTIHLHQSLIDFSTYKLGLAGVPFGIDLVSLLDRQPLQIMAKDGGSGDYVFNVLVWNKRLLYSNSPS